MLSLALHKIQSVIRPQELPKELAWMTTLAEMDELTALKEITAQLAKIQFSHDAPVRRSIEMVLGIDRKTYKPVRKVTHKYLNTLSLDKRQAGNIYDGVYAYQRQLYVTYANFFDVYLNQTKTLLSQEKLNLILGRYLNATFLLAKWRYFDDQPASVGTWSNVCKVIKCAENLSMMNTNLFLYDDQEKETSIAALLKHGFMMDTLQKGSYSRLQIQLTEKILSVWATNPLFLNRYKQDKMQFLINVESDRGPERIRAVEQFAEYRFWKTTRLVDKIEAYLCAVDTKKPLTEFGLEKLASPETIVKLFKKLRVDWCVEGYERQRRKETRNKRNKLIVVSYGFDSICRRIKELNPRLDTPPVSAFQATQQKLATENWWLVDESANGFGVDLGKSYSSWIEPGKLIGYIAPDNKKIFVLAEIKSVRKLANGHYRAGLQVLSMQGASVQIGRVDEDNMTEQLSGYYVDDSDTGFQAHNTFTGLFLKQEDDSKTGKASLILPRREYKRGNKLRLKMNGDDAVFEMGATLMKQRDWVRMALPL